MKVSCNVIKDIMPLYVEDMVSNDTRILVEDHLNGCEDCKNQLEKMKTPENIPVDVNTGGIKNIKVKLFREKFKAVVFWVMITVILSIAAVNYLTQPQYTPYSKEVIALNTAEDGRVFMDFSDEVAGYNIEKYLYEDGKGYVYHITTWNTIWNNYFHNKPGTIVLNPQGEKIRAVYYYTDDTNGYSTIDDSSDILIYGRSITGENGGVVTLPRLVLSYYFMTAVVLSIICFAVLMVLRKHKKLQDISVMILFIPIAYIVGHLLIKGFGSASYSAARDFCAILIISIPIYVVLVVGCSFCKRLINNKK